MGGDLKLKQSAKGLTIFTFKVPIKLQAPEEDFLEASSCQSEESDVKRYKLLGKNMSMSS